jgi:hypothetical protein
MSADWFSFMVARPSEMVIVRRTNGFDRTDHITAPAATKAYGCRFRLFLDFFN